MGAVVSLYNDDGWDNGKNSSHVGVLPTFFFGTSYFFNDVVGINGELGYNFTYAQVGVNFRFGR